MPEKYDRLYTAMVTPYEVGSYNIDEEQLRSLLRYFTQPRFVDARGAVIINPEAGEVFYMSREEKRRCAKIAVEECGGQFPVFAGVVGMRTRELVEVAKDAKEVGVDGIFLIPPIGSADLTYTWNPERYPEYWLDVAKQICDTVELPAITHPVAPASAAFGIGLPLSATMKMCQEIPQIVGWKMTYSYEGYRKVARGLHSLPHHVGVFTASASLYHEALLNEWMDGAVSGSLCYAMEPMVDHVQAWWRGDLKEARRLWNSGLIPLHSFISGDRSRLHVRYKVATWVRGLIKSPLMRPPMPKPNLEESLKLRSLFVNLGLSVMEEGAIREFFARPFPN